MNIVQLLDEYGINYVQQGEHHHATAGWVSVDCPLCSPNSGRYRGAFHIYSGRYNCWLCGKSNPVTTLAELLRVPGSKAYVLLKRSTAATQDIEPQAVDCAGVCKPPTGIAELQKQHCKYLHQRGINAAQVERFWGIRGIGIASRLPWSIYIPIFDRYGKLSSWTTRSLSDTIDNRYTSAKPSEERIPHKSLIYGQHLVRHAMVICEGPIDTWKIGPGAVATFGTVFTESQLSLLTDVPIRVVCFDNEKEAQRRAHQLCRQLSSYPGQTENVVLETGKDPGDADPAEISELRSTFLENLEKNKVN